MEKSKSRAVRKGAWTYEEDKLLKACIEKFGEGKWHLIPQRAGLNRCRKSCRFRWLNYVKPTINRESFSEDEVDMILRLHKLLGNRWSLIAARLFGRTANDVKNYWHTHLRKKMVSKNIEEKKEKEKLNETMNAHEVIKPQPRTVSSHSPWLNGKQIVKPTVAVSTKDASVARNSDIDAKWWESLLNLSNDKIGSCSLLQEDKNFLIEGPSTVGDCHWDSNLCEFDSLLEILNI
ncbi:transcription factor MYB1 [Lathyrus oleraceus]|uniref:Uncharacterized protein n=1 Tax=Pisum sativum TaxID=3888 RepID=A0A9D4Y9P3_PEA|nr:transcription factor MYB1-like [Pisum sativum]KAI5434509.1 hypothetical protein KIW84_021369 [Pisum sativum]